MTVTINGTTGYTGPIGAIGDLSTTGNTTLGDASGDTLTINGSTTTFTQGTANGVAYLNGSKVLTTGSALVFDGSNMGVGVTPSAWNSAYKVAEIGKIGTSLFAGTSSGNAILASNAYLNSSDAWTYANNGGAVYFRAANSDRSFTWNISSTGSGTAGAAATFTQAMTLDASGNLGLGVTPSASTSNYKTLQIGSSGNSY
ncbi:MAG: hypothetical protein EBW87_06255, partial [Burkholderiaceae bacterium]|nr:hypothetical protein [Burkholderiaceae bacterium]